MGSLGSSSTQVVLVEELLNALEPCLFPRLDDGVHATKSEHQVHVGIQPTVPELFAFCAKVGIQVPDLVKSAWAVTLGSYVGSADISFGTTSILLGGDDFSHEIKQSICNTTLNPDAAIRDLLHQVQGSREANQSLNVSEFHLALNKVADPVFNTEVLFYHNPDTSNTTVSKPQTRSGFKVRYPHLLVVRHGHLRTDMCLHRPISPLR